MDFSYFSLIFEGVCIILWYITRLYFHKFGCVLEVFYFTSSKVDFLMFTCLFNSNKFFQISPPFFSTTKEAEKEKIYHCIHNFVSHCMFVSVMLSVRYDVREYSSYLLRFWIILNELKSSIPQGVSHFLSFCRRGKLSDFRNALRKRLLSHVWMET